jgi:hypothetical protein
MRIKEPPVPTTSKPAFKDCQFSYLKTNIFLDGYWTFLNKGEPWLCVKTEIDSFQNIKNHP